ncbi:MAG TPA: hypothetical protein VJQ47_05830 [Steroidobacteraceae bacterium]|nr:hypothetical protein [Steroidobacteraceae bacterium]
MKAPRALLKAIVHFDRLSLRERALVVGAALALTFVAFDVGVLDPMHRRHVALTSELIELQTSITSNAAIVEAMNTSDPVGAALARNQTLQKKLDAANAELASRAGGLIAPQDMARVIQDMLGRHHGVTLVSLRNLPARRLLDAKGTASSSQGPYLHPAEIVLEGGYLDVLAYLQSLEQLPWRFYWQLLELQTATYPVNRVRVQLCTLSMTNHWIGL